MGTGGMTDTQARVAANALVFGYFAALEQWYLDGGVHPIATYVDEGMRPPTQDLAGGWIEQRLTRLARCPQPPPATRGLTAVSRVAELGNP